MRFTQTFVNKSAKMMIIAGLAIGISGSVFAQSTSIVSTMNNQAAASNTQVTTMDAKGGKSGGGPGGKSAGGPGGPGGKSAGGPGGTTGGNGGPPGCVPEPCTMLALGVGAGLVALKMRKANKAA